MALKLKIIKIVFIASATMHFSWTKSMETLEVKAFYQKPIDLLGCARIDTWLVSQYHRLLVQLS